MDYKFKVLVTNKFILKDQIYREQLRRFGSWGSKRERKQSIICNKL